MNKADLSVILGLPPEKAIAYLQAKGYAFSWDWYDVWERAHRRAFTVAKVLREDLLEDIRTAVQQALDGGQTFAEFRAALEPTLKAKGWWGKVALGDGAGGVEIAQLGSPWRLKTIYRTNLQTAYMAGRWKQQQEALAERPYLQYVAILDGRTRPSHAALHGKILPASDPFWRDFYPPNGWGCRCRVRALTAEDVAERGRPIESSRGKITRVEKVVSETTGELRQVAEYSGRDNAGKPFRISPDVGWSYNPGMSDWLGDPL